MLLGLEIAGYSTPYSGPLPVVRRNPVLGPGAPYDPSIWYQDPHGGRGGRGGSHTPQTTIYRGTSPPRLPGSGAPLPEPIPQPAIYSLPMLFQFVVAAPAARVVYPDQPVPAIEAPPTTLDAVGSFGQGSGTADALTNLIYAMTAGFGQGSGTADAATSFLYDAVAAFAQGSGTFDATASLLIAATGTFGQGSGTVDATGDIQTSATETIYFMRHRLRR